MTVDTKRFYIGVKPCGCITAAMVDDKSTTAGEIADLCPRNGKNRPPGGTPRTDARRVHDIVPRVRVQTAEVAMKANKSLLWMPGHDASTQTAGEAALARQRMIWFARDGLARARHAREQGHTQVSWDHDGWFDQMAFVSLHIQRAMVFSAELRSFKRGQQLTFDLLPND